jgi:hypothetical protein
MKDELLRCRCQRIHRRILRRAAAPLDRQGQVCAPVRESAPHKPDRLKERFPPLGVETRMNNVVPVGFVVRATDRLAPIEGQDGGGAAALVTATGSPTA